MKAIIAGTFDPITLGHLDLIKRSRNLCGTDGNLLVAVAHNPSKQTWLDLEERLTLVKASLANLDGVVVLSFTGLLANLALQEEADYIIRGVRNTMDFEYESQLSVINRQLTAQNHREIETIFVPALPQWQFLSSTIVREVFMHGGDISNLVPEPVLKHLQI